MGRVTFVAAAAGGGSARLRCVRSLRTSGATASAPSPTTPTPNPILPLLAAPKSYFAVVRVATRGVTCCGNSPFRDGVPLSASGVDGAAAAAPAAASAATSTSTSTPAPAGLVSRAGDNVIADAVVIAVSVRLRLPGVPSAFPQHLAGGLQPEHHVGPPALAP